MITRIYKDEYRNIIELAWIFIKREFYTAMEFLMLVEPDDHSWNLRPTIWFIVSLLVTSYFFCNIASIPAAILFGILVSAETTRLMQVSLWK